MVLFWVLTSTFLVSLISLVGIFTLAVKDELLQKILFCLVGFSAGALIGGAFLHILPECLENNSSSIVFSYLILGIIIFFMLERFLHWRHCHEGGVCKTHAFTYLTLIGDGFHNFIDGMVIAVSFTASFQLGLVATLAIILHEIPQELGDYAILIYGGFTKKKALLCNFVSALMAVIGALVGYFISGVLEGFTNFILPLTAGGFIYIATSDLIPELHKENNLKRAMSAFSAFLLGIILMALLNKFLPG